MATARYGGNLTAGGISIDFNQTRTGDGQIGADPTIPVALSGTLSTRTDNDTGVFTGSGPSLLSENDVVDVYWTGGRRYGMAVGTPSGSTYPLEGGTGDNLPAQDAAINVSEQTQVNCSIDGDALETIGFKLVKADGSTARGHITLKDAAADVIANVDLLANELRGLDMPTLEAFGITNPFAGDPITTLHVTQSDSSATGQLLVAGVQDATP